MKLISMHVNDVVKLSRGDEVIEVMVTDSDRRRKKTHLGVKADRVWQIELFKGVGRKPESESKEKTM